MHFTMWCDLVLLQNTYPSDLRNGEGERKSMILWRLVPCGGTRARALCACLP